MAICVALVGCERSDKALQFANSQLVVDSPRQLFNDAIGVAVTSDGTKIADVRPDIDKKKLNLEVRDSETNAVLWHRSTPFNNGPTPLLFGRDGYTLLFLSEASLSRLDWRTGEERELPYGIANPRRDALSKARDLPENCCRNSDWTLVATQDGIVNSDGKFVPLEIFLGYDTFGNGWGIAGGQTMRVDREGRVATLAKPKYLTYGQQAERGSMHLVEQKQQLTYRRASAHIHAIWVDDSHSLPVSGSGSQAALAFAGNDLYAFGFVPGQQSIYAVTADGTYFIPYHKEPLKG